MQINDLIYLKASVIAHEKQWWKILKNQSIRFYMKRLLLIAIISALFFGCASTDASINKNIKIVEQYVKSVQTKDEALMNNLLADSYMGYGPGINDSVNKTEAIANWRWVSDSLYESIEYTQQKSIGVIIREGQNQGDWVSNWAYLTVHYKNHNAPVHLWLNAIYRIENNRIVSSRTFYNAADVMSQLGYIMVPDNSEGE